MMKMLGEKKKAVSLLLGCLQLHEAMQSRCKPPTQSCHNRSLSLFRCFQLGRSMQGILDPFTKP